MRPCCAGGRSETRSSAATRLIPAQAIARRTAGADPHFSSAPESRQQDRPGRGMVEWANRACGMPAQSRTKTATDAPRGDARAAPTARATGAPGRTTAASDAGTPRTRAPRASARGTHACASAARREPPAAPSAAKTTCAPSESCRSRRQTPATTRTPRSRDATGNGPSQSPFASFTAKSWLTWRRAVVMSRPTTSSGLDCPSPRRGENWAKIRVERKKISKKTRSAGLA